MPKGHSPWGLWLLLAAWGLAAPAQVRLVTCRAVAQIGDELLFYASREDGRTGKWRWTLLEPEGVGSLRPFLADRAHARYLPDPWAPAPERVRVRVTDTEAPEGPGAFPDAETEVLLVPAMLSLTAPARLFSGEACRLVVSQADGVIPGCRWALLEGQGGRIRAGEAGHAQYQAPEVSVASTFHVQVQSEAGYGLTAPIRVLPRLAWQVARQDLVAGSQLRLAARRLDGKEARPAFRVLEPGGGSLAWGPGRAVLYTAPEVAAPATFTLEVRDLGSENQRDRARLAVYVLPRIPASGPGPGDRNDYLFQELMPKVMGARDMTHLPMATLIAGQLGWPAHLGVPTAFQGIACLAFLEAEAAAGALSRRWLVADTGGIQAVWEGDPGGDGEPERPPLLESDERITAMAVRPPGQAPDNPYRVLYATLTGEEEVIGVIHQLRAEGDSQPLAGKAAYAPGRDASALEATFGRIGGLAVAGDGTVYVADEDRLRCISAQGDVSTLATLVEAPWNDEDEDDDVAVFTGLALDPASGCLYLQTPGSVYQVSRDGEASVVLARQDPRWALPGQDPAPPRQGCGLHYHGGKLYLPDPGQHVIRVFELGTGRCYPLVGDPSQPGDRMGPLGAFAPGWSPGDCASLAAPCAIAINAEGTCLAGLPFGVVHLELGATHTQRTP